MRPQDECKKLINSVMGNKNAAPFNEPVDYIALGVPDYPNIISHPMDFGTIKQRLGAGEYATLDQLAADCRLVFANAQLFNPPDHIVHKMATDLSKFFEKKFATLEAKLDSRQLGSKPADGAGGQRGNREWPRACRRVIKAVQDHPDSYPFHHPVDWKKLGIPEYPKIVKKPMDLSKVEKKLTNSYESSENFVSDMDLVFENAKLFNLEGSQIYNMAETVQEFFRSECSKHQLAMPQNEKKRKHRDAELGGAIKTVKTLLNQNLGSLRSTHLAEMVDLVKERCPMCISQQEDDKIEIDVDQIAPNDLEYISEFVVQCITSYTA